MLLVEPAAIAVKDRIELVFFRLRMFSLIRKLFKIKKNRLNHMRTMQDYSFRGFSINLVITIALKKNLGMEVIVPKCL